MKKTIQLILLVFVTHLYSQIPIITSDGPTTFCAGGSLNLTSSAGSSTRWYKDGVPKPSPISNLLGGTGSGPRNIAFDAAGNLYTANFNSSNVTKITPAGVSTILGTTGNAPWGIVIDAAGNVYTANNGSDNVTKITPSGVSSILGTTGVAPREITIDASGNVYTSNYNSNNVSKITPAGVSSILGATGARPEGIVIDVAGNVYTANSFSNNVTKITPAGVSSIFASTGSIPRGIAIDVAGNLYTANTGGSNVSKITPSGVSSILGTTGSGPYGISIDGAGNIYTSNYTSNNVSIITPDGVSSIFGTAGTAPQDITVDAVGNVYTANFNSGNVTKISYATSATQTVTSLISDVGSNSVYKAEILDGNGNPNFSETTVTIVAVPTISYAATSSIFIKGSPVALNPISTNAVSYSVTPELPAGLNLNTVTGVISGTPTAVTPEGNYIVLAENGICETPFNIRITVNDTDPSLSPLVYSTPNFYTKGTGITALVPVYNGSPLVSYAVTSGILPLGLNFDTATGIISGTPTVLQAETPYTVTGTNSGGFVISNSFTINIVDADTDGDGILDTADNAPLVPNPDQLDTDGDGISDVIDTDDDNDGVLDGADNCPLIYNSDQLDTDGDGIGDVCDSPIDNKLKVSQAITPNGDGINDFWMIQGIEYHPNTKVSVFNRWGSEVYHSNNYNNDWNGNGLDGDTLPKSSYFYKIDMDGKGITYLQGWLYITK